MVVPQSNLAEETTQGEGEPASAEVEQALAQILASQLFKKSIQCSKLLSYIVKHTLSREDALLRERVIGAEIFARPPAYETAEDPIVRLRVAEVRKRLAQYYQSASDTLQIGIPSGGYRATFHRKGITAAHGFDRGHDEERTILPTNFPDTVVPEPATLAVEIEAPVSKGRLRRLPLTWLVSACVLVLCAAIVGVLAHNGYGRSDYKRFWGPWLDNPKPTLISIGSNAVYRLRWEYVDRYAREHGLEASGQEFYIPFKPDDSISASDLQPAYNSFVATNDVFAISYISTALTKQSVSFQERFPGDISFAELRSSPSVLVGGFNNPMTVELTKHLPFVMNSGSEIDETQTPNRKWTLHVQVGTHDTADYAIISRLPGNGDDPPLMSVAGLGGYGTEAAAKLVTDPKAIEELVHALPRGWEKRNLQVVLSIKVSDFKVTSREVVASRVW
jgi:hypothetical protein